MESWIGYVERHDAEVGRLLAAEGRRQRSTLSLIPSENYTSKAVQLALATSYTN